MTTTPTVLILGANGRFGLAAARAFDAAGWQVLAHVRRDAAGGMPPAAEILRAPLSDLEQALASRRAAVPGVVVHGINPVYTRWEEEALPAVRQGMDIAERFNARFMLPGNVYNHGEAMPAVLDESTPQRPSTAKGRLRVAMERELESRTASGTLRATTIRAGDFFGAGSGGWLDQVIVKSIANGKLDYPGGLDLMHAWAYVPDLARTFVAVAARPSSSAFERFAFAGHAVTGRTFVAAVERAAARLGLEPAGGWRHGTVPWTFIRTVGVVVPMWRELARMSYLWRVPHRLDGRALDAAVGSLQGTSLEDALFQTLSEMDLLRTGRATSTRQAA